MAVYAEDLNENYEAIVLEALKHATRTYDAEEENTNYEELVLEAKDHETRVADAEEENTNYEELVLEALKHETRVSDVEEENTNYAELVLEAKYHETRVADAEEENTNYEELVLEAKDHETRVSDVEKLNEDGKAVMETLKNNRETKFFKKQNIASGEVVESLYDVALGVIKKHKLRKMTEGETNMVWMFNGRFYEPMTTDKLENLVYSYFEETFKRTCNRIQPILNHIIDYIRLELSAKSKKRKFFTEKDYAKIQNHIVFRNCVFDCKKRETLPFTDELPYWFGVDAEYVVGEEFSAPYEKLKRYATNNDEDSMLMLDYLTAALFLHRQIKHIFVVGNASNSGKSKYFEFIDTLIGRPMHLEPSELKGKFALENADTATLLSCADIQMGEVGPKVASTLKRLTGDQYVRFQKKFKGSQEVRVMAKVLLGTNGAFVTDRPDPGIQNRLIVLPFIKSVEPEHRDEKLLVKLLADRDIIMSYCARRLGDIIGKDDSITFPQSAISQEMKNSWLAVVDFVEDFFQERVEVTGDELDVMNDKKLYVAYEEFFYHAAEELVTTRCNKVSKQELIKRLEKFSCGQAGRRRGLIDENGTKCKNAVSRIRGIKLKTSG